MKRRMILLIIGGSATAILAYFLREIINEKIVIPFAFLWWRIGIYYRSIAESTWIILSVVVLSIIAYAGLVNDEHLLRGKSQNGEHSILGPVEEFMIWLMKSPRRSYYRWLVANQLARLARLFLIQREGHDVQRWDGSLEGSGWNPPKDVETYLMYGLRRSSADLQPSPASWGQPKIDKLDPQKAVEYLESEIGDRYHGN